MIEPIWDTPFTFCVFSSFSGLVFHIVLHFSFQVIAAVKWFGDWGAPG